MNGTTNTTSQSTETPQCPLQSCYIPMRYIQNSHFRQSIRNAIRHDTEREVVADIVDKLESVVSISDSIITYSEGLRSGLQSVSCKHFLRQAMANIDSFTRLCSLYLENYDGPLFMEKWPQSLQVVSLVKEHDPLPLNRLFNLRKLGLFQQDVDLALLAGIAPQLQELAFGSCLNEEFLAMFLNVEWLTYGKHRGDFSPLKNLKRLRHLFVENYQHTTLDGLEGCERLSHLRVQSKDLLDISALKDCKSLREVTFVSTGEGIRSIEPLKCSNLYTLDISYSGVTDFTPLQTMKQLQEVKLNGCLIDDLSVLEGLENLDTVYLGEVASCSTPDFFKPLLKLPRLYSVYVSPAVYCHLPEELQNRSALWFNPVGLNKNVADADKDLNTDLGDTLTDEEFNRLLAQFR